MIRFFLPVLTAALMLASCGGEQAAPTTPSYAAAVELSDGTYVINKVKPKVTWAAQRLTGDGHNGTLHIDAGKFQVTDGAITEGVVLFDMSRMEVSDLTGDAKQNLEGHLRSGDFFNVEENPQATLEITAVTQNGDRASLKTTLTMNGVAADYTIPVQLVPASIPGTGDGLAIQGKFVLDRTKHNIVYRSKSFDDKLDWFIKDEVTLGFSVMGVPVGKP
ncbi:YceI family protein [Flavobacteriales bacterium]|nr:YceI family protein [Flavobacteriales bacterium]